MATDASLTTATRPRDVVNAAGAWLGAALAAEGFRWLPRRRRLEREAGGLLHRISLAPSAYNRTGSSIEVTTYVSVHDPALRARRGGDDDLVCGHALGYTAGRANGYVYGDFTDGQLQLADPVLRLGVLERFAATVREGVLPWFAEASDVETVVGSFAGDHTANPEALVDWLASRGRPDLVAAYGARYLARHPGREEGWAARIARGNGGPPAGR
ncbi:hypothetical protein [Dactylosporangium sp. NPDC048998]|uniref:hypothetical protein n=1 Tax=Dactylosporangium sp. NPDC048998 TaxID=3363976 RepID=UPI00371743EA